MIAVSKRAGPLSGLKVIEFAGVGPGPMAAMMLADLGATVLRIDRAQPADLGLKRELKFQFLLRSRESIALDLKDPRAIALALRLVESSDALLEGFRPGVMERLGLGPDVCLARNPRLVYGRITGWGQTGPLASAVGHDLNYLAITGVLNALGREGQPPTAPMNLLGDFGGGGMLLAFGILAGVLDARASGRGQVVDASIVDGVMALQASLLGMWQAGMVKPERGTNAIDSGSHFYNVYECADGQWISVAPIEERFHADLLARMDIDPGEIGDHLDPKNWPHARELLAARFKTRTRDAWLRIMEGGNACIAPVLSWEQARVDPHLLAREAFVDVDGLAHPAPAPRFSKSALERPTSPRETGAADAGSALAPWLDAGEIAALQDDGVLR